MDLPCSIKIGRILFNEKKAKKHRHTFTLRRQKHTFTLIESLKFFRLKVDLISECI